MAESIHASCWALSCVSPCLAPNDEVTLPGWTLEQVAGIVHHVPPQPIKGQSSCRPPYRWSSNRAPLNCDQSPLTSMISHKNTQNVVISFTIPNVVYEISCRTALSSSFRKRFSCCQYNPQESARNVCKMHWTCGSLLGTYSRDGHRKSLPDKFVSTRD